MNFFVDANTSSCKMMVVDDEEPVRKMILRGIERNGYDCIGAANGEEALEIMKKSPIDIVITDINMPGLNGIDLTRKIKENHNSDVIIMTGFTKDFSYENVVAYGASDFIQKPIILKELNLRIRRVLRERRILTENMESLKKLKKALGGIIYAMAMTIEIRDPYTAGHQRRSANLARAIGRELSLSPLQLEGLSMGSVIHDLGKISIPSEILAKPGDLTELEFEFIKTHPKVGYDILKTIDFPWPLAEMALQHHERLDGSGYPFGVKADEIIFEAKILAVADVVDAMMSHRPYRPSLSMDEALEFILEQRGIGFDPQAVDACVYVFREKGFSL